MRKIAILGCTGSIGTQALEMVERTPAEFQVTGLAAGRQVGRLADQVRRHRPEWVVVAGEPEAVQLKAELGAAAAGVAVEWGERALAERAAAPADLVLVAVVGARGLLPSLKALEAGHTVALANKETLVAGGALVADAARRGGGRLIPVDSEHSAIFQCLAGGGRSGLAGLILTASGGPFRGRRPEELASVTAAEALAHPTWRMGSRITVDSATLMNKGLEVIEAHWLFGVGYPQIQVVIHPESIVHSLVEMADGSVLAQLGWPDMRLPIHYALHYPDRRPSGLRPFDLAAAGPLNFLPVEWGHFPCLRLAIQAGAAGGTWPAVLNASDEVAVEAFLSGRIGFTKVAAVVEEVLERYSGGAAGSLDEVLEADAWARRKAAEVVAHQ